MTYQNQSKTQTTTKSMNSTSTILKIDFQMITEILNVLSLNIINSSLKKKSTDSEKSKETSEDQ